VAAEMPAKAGTKEPQENSRNDYRNAMKQKQGKELYQNCHSLKNASNSRDAETPSKTV
jgi:hypothetical protein